MKKNNKYQKWVSYESVGGGVNNLQVVKITTLSKFSRLSNIVKTFTSKKNKAIERAEKWILNN